MCSLPVFRRLFVWNGPRRTVFLTRSATGRGTSLQLLLLFPSQWYDGKSCLFVNSSRHQSCVENMRLPSQGAKSKKIKFGMSENCAPRRNSLSLIRRHTTNVINGNTVRSFSCSGLATVTLVCCFARRFPVLQTMRQTHRHKPTLQKKPSQTEPSQKVSTRTKKNLRPVKYTY